MVNRYLKKDKWMDATGVGWCNVVEPERTGDSWRVEYHNGHEHDGDPSGVATPIPAMAVVKINADYGSGNFGKKGLQIFIAACTEALDMIIDHENDPQYPAFVGFPVKEVNSSEIPNSSQPVDEEQDWEMNG